MWETLFPGGSGHSSVGMGRPLLYTASASIVCLKHDCVQAMAHTRSWWWWWQSVGPSDRLFAAAAADCFEFVEQLQLLVLACFHPVIQ